MAVGDTVKVYVQISGEPPQLLDNWKQAIQHVNQFAQGDDPGTVFMCTLLLTGGLDEEAAKQRGIEVKMPPRSSGI